MKWVLSSSFVFNLEVVRNKLEERCLRDEGLYLPPFQSSTSVSLVCFPAHLVLKPYKNSIPFPSESKNLPCAVQHSFSWLLYLKSPLRQQSRGMFGNQYFLTRIMSQLQTVKTIPPKPFYFKRKSEAQL